MITRFFKNNSIIIGLVILGACTTITQNTPSSIPTTITPVSQTSSQILYTPTFTSTLLPTDTPISTNTNTPTLSATLSINDAYKALNELLNDNGCHLPCWLRITPGSSTLQDVHGQLTEFSSIARSFHGLQIEPAGKWSLGIFEIPRPNDSKVIEIAPSYLTSPESGLVTVIAIHALAYRVKNGDRGLDTYDYPPFNDLMKRYTLASVFSEFGSPDQIYIYVIPTTPLGYFQIHVWYPEKGIFIIYNLSAQDSGDNYRLCPVNALISGYLIQPNTQGYQEFLLKLHEDLYKNFFPPSSYVKTTDEAFGLTSADFYQLFRSASTRCLNTPKTVWPVLVGP